MSMAFILKKKICSMSSSSVLIGVLVVTGFVILYIRHVYVHLDDVPSQSSSSEGSIKHTTSRGGSDESWRVSIIKKAYKMNYFASPSSRRIVNDSQVRF